MLLVVFAGTLSGCNSIRREYADVGLKSRPTSLHGRMRLVVYIRDFEPHGMYDHFSDGTYADYAVTMLDVVEPEGSKGRKLQIVQDARLAPGTMWSEVGRRCSIELDAWMLENPETFINPDDVRSACD